MLSGSKKVRCPNSANSAGSWTSRVSISISGTPAAMIWFAASTSASLADGCTATKSKPCDEIVCRSCSCFSTANSPSKEVTSTPKRSPKNLAVSMPCETHVEPAPTSDVAALYFFSGRSSGSRPSEARPCAAVTRWPTPVATARAPSVAKVPLNASPLEALLQQVANKLELQPGKRTALRDFTHRCYLHLDSSSSVPATTAGERCTASPRDDPGSRFRHAEGNFGAKGKSG